MVSVFPQEWLRLSSPAVHHTGRTPHGQNTTRAVPSSDGHRTYGSDGHRTYG